MNIAIISDLHDKISNLELFFKAISKEKIQKIICCGDLGQKESLRALATGFKKEIIIVLGNADLYNSSELDSYQHLRNLGRFSSLELDAFRVAVCHEPAFIKSFLQENPKPKFIFYGHTHKPWISKKNETILINPGTLGGIFYRPSFAIWDSKSGKAKLKIIH